ncbi:MAG: helix-turn-helix domain-containing protein [Treponema sp.]|nr:helix-turn-helix domain-containing protein [Treponema sp.]
MDNSQDLREILSQNVKSIRNTLHISQAKLAEHTDISLSYLVDIERCRTWVSHKTLQNLARALNREAWELLLPATEENSPATKQETSYEQRNKMRHMADLIVKKRDVICLSVNQTMEDLIMEMLKE